MTAQKQPLRIVCVHDEWGWSHDQFNILKASIEKSKPDYWEFFNPGTVMIYFQDTKKGISRSQDLLKSLQKSKTKITDLEKLGIGSSNGEMVFETNVWGKIISSPLGGAANQATELAKSSAISR